MKALRVFGGFLLFFFIFFILAALGMGIPAAYSFRTLKNRISEEEERTKTTATALADACARMAESGKPDERGKRLEAYFTENREKGLFFRAFLVSANGTIIAHSDPAEKENLRGNIATDEFRYNIDLILEPARKNSAGVLFSDYFIMEKEIPFSREELKLLKRYLYPGIDRTGWIASRAVFEKDSPIGTVNFIIGKERIYHHITATRQALLRLAPAIGAGSLAAAVAIFLFSLLVFSRRRERSRGECVDAPTEEIDVIASAPAITAASRRQNEPVTVFYDEETSQSPQMIIQDAIPIRKRRNYASNS